jgi:flagellar protein FlaF
VNAIDLARRAYAPERSPILGPRAVEHRLIADVTARLGQAASAGPRGFQRLASALHENRRLWATLAANVASRDNALPEQLRAQLFYLAEFTTGHSRKVLRGEASVGPLIEINTAVMRGLAATQVQS